MKKSRVYTKYTRKQFMKNAGGALLGGGLLSAAGLPFVGKAQAATRNKESKRSADAPFFVNHVSADPTDIPGPIKRNSPETVDVELEAKEMIGEIEDGVKFNYMTFGSQIPSPFIRVRQGDTINFKLTSHIENAMIHNIDFHSVYGTGGGADATYVTPGASEKIRFKAMYPGAYIYHCAVPKMDQHISAGMYGMILVEPEEGLPEVDHEFYLGQNEIYIENGSDARKVKKFDFDKMEDEIPDYVLLNGEAGALKEGGSQGTMKVKKGETARLFFVNGGPNLASSFHPIGNVFTKAWREGAIVNDPERYIQTMTVPPGSCGVFEMEFPVPSTIHLVDHALSRVENKGFGGDIVVEGEEDLDIYNAEPED